MDLEKTIAVGNASVAMLEREADKSFVYDFRAAGTAFPSAVQVDIWANQHAIICMLTDINVGRSVTNAAAQIITEIYWKNLSNYLPQSCLFIETYDKEKGIDAILPVWDGNKVTSVNWKHLGKILKQA